MVRKKFTREMKAVKKPKGIDALFSDETGDDQNNPVEDQRDSAKKQKEPKSRASFIVKNSTLHNLRAYAYKHRMKNSELLDLCVTKFLSQVDAEDLKDALEMYKKVG